MGARARGQALRVVSLNCAGGNARAAAEVARYHPDIVLLQETPLPVEVAQLARRLFGKRAAYLCGTDDSIIARGGLTPRRIPAIAPFVQARVRLDSGIEAEVISLRLLPPVARFDLFLPDCWREHASNRSMRREQLRDIAAHVRRIPASVPLIAGGDFNVPARESVLTLLQPRLRDAFAEGGVGWGNTAVNEVPLQRIDQVWVNDRFRAVGVVARRTRHSDHRMVICDLWLRQRGR